MTENLNTAAAAQSLAMQQMPFLRFNEYSAVLDVIAAAERAGRTFEVNRDTNAIAVGAGTGHTMGEFLILIEDGVDAIYEGTVYGLHDLVSWAM